MTANGKNETCSAVSTKAFEKPLKYTSSDLLLAFMLTTGAGLATALGTLPVLCVSEDSGTALLGYSLAFAAGVMIYISFIEILAEALLQFEHSQTGGLARFYTFLTFFGGVFFGYLIDLCVHCCLGKKHTHGLEDHDFQAGTDSEKIDENAAVADKEAILEPTIEKSGQEKIDVEDNDEVKAELIIVPESIELGKRTPENEDCPHPVESTDSKKTSSAAETSKLDLLQVSFVTGLAIAAHNLPEGLVTFVSTLHDPKLGGAVACAIAIHNIPEGISIAMPIYYHKKSMCTAFLWCLASGITEPIGALIGYGILDSMFGSDVFGMMFGMVGGIMVYISFVELLPTAMKTDAKYINVAVFAGMVVMEISLIMFAV